MTGYPPTVEECRVAQAWADAALPVAVLASLGRYVPGLRIDEVVAKLGDDRDLHVFVGDWEMTLCEDDFSVSISAIAHHVTYRNLESPWFPRIVEAVTNRFLRDIT